MRKRSLTFVGRLVAAGVLGGLGVIASPRPVEAQAVPYPISYEGPLDGRLHPWSCLDWKEAQPNQAVSTSCWLRVVWFVGSPFPGINRYERIAEAVSSESFACPNRVVDHGSSVWRYQGPEGLGWEAYIGGDLTRFVSFLNGHCNVGGMMVRDVSRKGIDPTACNS